MTLNNFQFNTTPGVRFGSGQSKISCKEIFDKLGNSILFITDKGLMNLGLTKPTIEELKKMSSVEVFDEIEAYTSKKTLFRSISLRISPFTNIILESGPETNWAFFTIIVLKKACVRYPSLFSKDLQ